MTCPSGKIAYASPQAARRAMDKMQRRKTTNSHALSWAKGKCVAYRCGFCREWHNGHTAVGRAA